MYKRGAKPSNSRSALREHSKQHSLIKIWLVALAAGLFCSHKEFSVKINQWFGGKVIPGKYGSRQEEREALFSHVDREKDLLHEYYSVSSFPIYIWCVDQVWYWSDEDLDGDIYIFPDYLNGAALEVIERFMATLEAAYQSGIEEGKIRKVCQFNRLMNDFRDETKE